MLKKNTRCQRRQKGRKTRRRRRYSRGGAGGDETNASCGCDKCMQAFKYTPPHPRPTRDYGIYELTLVNTGEDTPTVLFNPMYPNEENYPAMDLVPRMVKGHGKELQNFNPAFQKKTIDSMFSYPVLRTFKPYKKRFVFRGPYRLTEKKRKQKWKVMEK